LRPGSPLKNSDGPGASGLRAQASLLVVDDALASTSSSSLAWAPQDSGARPIRVLQRAARARVAADRLVLAALILAAVACGERGPPRPPEPRGPLPPETVRVRQVGADAVAGVVIPQPRGERDAQQPVRAELVRVSYPAGIEPSSDADAFRRRGVLVASAEGNPLSPGSAVTIIDASVRDLEQGGEGSTLRYGVRVRDRRGRPSPLVVARDLRFLPVVGAPRELEGEPTADGIRLSWSPPPGEGPFRYNVYRPSDEGTALADPLNTQPLEETAYLDTTVTVGQAYRYVVRVALSDARPFTEGPDSGGIGLSAEDRFAPSAPEGLVAVQEGLGIRLFWDPNPERDIRGYRVYRRNLTAGADSTWGSIGPDPVERPLYLDSDVRIGQRLEYRVTAVDRASRPNESEPSPSQTVDVREEPTAVGEDGP